MPIGCKVQQDPPSYNTSYRTSAPTGCQTGTQPRSACAYLPVLLGPASRRTGLTRQSYPYRNTGKRRIACTGSPTRPSKGNRHG